MSEDSSTATDNEDHSSTRGVHVHSEVNLVSVDKNGKEDEELNALILPFKMKLQENMKKVIGYSSVDLECRFNKVRTGETNLGNECNVCLYLFVSC